MRNRHFKFPWDPDFRAFREISRYFLRCINECEDEFPGAQMNAKANSQFGSPNFSGLLHASLPCAGVVARLAPTHAHKHLSDFMRQRRWLTRRRLQTPPIRQSNTGENRCTARRMTMNAGRRGSAYRVTRAEIQRTAHPRSDADFPCN